MKIAELAARLRPKNLVSSGLKLGKELLAKTKPVRHRIRNLDAHHDARPTV